MYKCRHCGKEFDDKHKLAGHSTHCKLNPKYEHNMECLSEARKHVSIHAKRDFNKENIQYCQYCGKECYNKNSLVNHERLCSQNPNKKETNLGTYIEKGHKAWNHGLTKESDDRVLKSAEKLSQRYKNGELKIWIDGLTKETDERVKHISESVSRFMTEYVKSDAWGPSVASKIRYEYKGYTLHGTWELAFAQYLDERCIKWERKVQSFKYIWKGKEHLYFPDFYLPDKDIYIEIKGIPSKRDYAKWDSLIDNYNKKLNVYLYEDLINLGVKIEGNGVYDIPEKYKEKHEIT